MANTNALPNRLQALSKAIDRVLIADHSQRHWLKNCPPLSATYADAVNHYGGPGVGLDLWCMCAAVEEFGLSGLEVTSRWRRIS